MLFQRLCYSSFLYISLLDTIVFSSFLKAKYILLDAQASIKLITSPTSHVCSGHFSHIDYVIQNLHQGLLTGFIIYSLTKHKRINETIL